jgi:hypothetical protein
MAFPFQLTTPEDALLQFGYDGENSETWEAGYLAGIQVLSDWFQDRQAADLTQFRGQISRVYSDLDYQMKWISDQLKEDNA